MLIRIIIIIIITILTTEEEEIVVAVARVRVAVARLAVALSRRRRRVWRGSRRAVAVVAVKWEPPKIRRLHLLMKRTNSRSRKS